MTNPHRVVVTGLGVIAPNGNGAREFELALRKGKSGLRIDETMLEAKLACHVSGVPEGIDQLIEASFDQELQMSMNSSHRFAALASIEAWQDAGLVVPDVSDDEVHWDTGAVIGTGVGGIDTMAERVVPLVNAGKVRRIGSTGVEQVMGSGVSARVSGILALGNAVTTNSTACATGVEAIVMGADRVRRGLATRMVCGGVEGASVYIWAGFDAMRVLCRGFNDEPEKASRPMSASAGGFIPGSGAGIVVLESLESAEQRGATIHAEVLGGATNCGGHRMGGSMTSPNPESVRRCIRAALDDGGVAPEEVDAISGHLTATGADSREVGCWATALEREPSALPTITSTKSMIGHALGAAGAIESVAAIQMVRDGFVHASINCEDVHPEIAPYAASIPHETVEAADLRTMVKAGFGFGDVNAALVLRRYSS
ncbi:MAG: beta-ketoacyl-[acyl-carrier-protein] synthase family protein [bacterium]|nr:beta-ketoacyl-[acyl-carrier-protein] synthase family protein [bacterium]MCP5069988.1 beta-ketoacyl-[acyl-carrier-protein] synthase family protein [bacterium]